MGPTPSGWWPVLGAWLTARVIVLGALALAGDLHRRTSAGGRFDSLVGWDAAWYHDIASSGYARIPHQGLRFFPEFPLLARGLATLPGVSVGTALVVLANGFALLYGLLLHRLAIREGFGPAVAARLVWVAALAPAGFVLVMGYAEPLSGCLITGIALAVRARRWWPAALLGLLAGALRPTGVTVTILVMVEASRHLGTVPWRELAGRLAAAAAPTLGLLSYLLWVRQRFGSMLEPFRVQTSGQLRGAAFVNPGIAMRIAVRGLVAGHLPSEAVHLFWVLLCLGLLVLCARRLPVSFTALSACIVLLGMTARSLQSYERYAASAVPLLLAAALVPVPRWLRPGILATGGAALGGYEVFAALHLYVP